MSKIPRFVVLIAWQKARKLVQQVYQVIHQELFAKDFHRYLSIAKASCAELRSQWYVALDIGYLTLKQFGEVLAQSEEVSRIIGGLRTSVQPSNTLVAKPK